MTAFRLALIALTMSACTVDATSSMTPPAPDATVEVDEVSPGPDAAVIPAETCPMLAGAVGDLEHCALTGESSDICFAGLCGAVATCPEFAYSTACQGPELMVFKWNESKKVFSLQLGFAGVLGELATASHGRISGDALYELPAATEVTVTFTERAGELVFRLDGLDVTIVRYDVAL